jgi:HK97 family phage prohead protease
MKIERRALGAPLEVRADGQTVAGYAAIFNSETDIGGMFREKIAPGAFKPSLTGDVRALWNHDSSHVLGRTKAGTLRLSEDDRGLAVEIDLPDTQAGRDLRENMRLGNVDGMSFGFRVTKQEWDESGDIPLRTINEVELFEVSAVTFPAYEDTELALRSLDDERGKRELAERNAAAAKARIAARKAESEQKFRGIK